MMKIYKWRGHTYQIDDADLGLYPGAEPVEKKKPEPVKPEKEKKKTTANKKKTPANKARQTQKK